MTLVPWKGIWETGTGKIYWDHLLTKVVWPRNRGQKYCATKTEMMPVSALNWKNYANKDIHCNEHNEHSFSGETQKMRGELITCILWCCDFMKLEKMKTQMNVFDSRKTVRPLSGSHACRERCSGNPAIGLVVGTFFQHWNSSNVRLDHVCMHAHVDTHKLLKMDIQ